MEAVKQKFKITVVAYHTTSMIPMPRYLPPAFGIRTTACQDSYSASTQSLNVTHNSSTNNYQLSQMFQV